MPPKRTVTGKVRGKGQSIVVEVESEDERQESVAQMEEERDDEEREERDDAEEVWDPGRMRVESKIVEFFEARPYFYDIGSEDYKNKKRRNAELTELAAELGRPFDAASVWKRFTSNRTDYGKLRNRIKKSKSGSQSYTLTSIARWKLSHYAFLDAYIRTRRQDEEMGKVSLSQASRQSRDEEEEEAPAADDSLVQPCTSSTTSQAKKARKAGSALADVLTRFLEQTRQEDLDAASQMKSLTSTPDDNPRVSWARWLASVAQEIPSESFRQWQRDTFEASMRYLPMRPLPPGVVLPPPPPVSQVPVTQPSLLSLLSQAVPPPQHTWQQQQQQPQQYIIGEVDTRPHSAPGILSQAFSVLQGGTVTQSLFTTAPSTEASSTPTLSLSNMPSFSLSAFNDSE